MVMKELGVRTPWRGTGTAHPDPPSLVAMMRALVPA